jgi:decaprenylphospho-beta-D-erythro-pentofuranosid-2-ulose 2-reductase
MSDNILILGATSGIAKALARRLASRGCHLLLAGRNGDELGRLAADCHTRFGVTVHIEVFDALAFDEHPAFIDRCFERFDGELHGVILCHGYMTEQEQCQSEFAEARRTIDINFTSAVSLLEQIAGRYERTGSGYIAAISSVAGDRGRQSNYVYGSSKAALSAYLQGLRHRLYRSKVPVLTIKPGFVDTPMTFGKLKPNSPLVASPERVAADIDRAIRRRRNVLYTPWFWRPIMWIIRCLPEPLFKRTRL